MIAVAIVAVVRPLRESVLLAVGQVLVVADAVKPVDVIVVSPHAGAAGVLEAADLAASGYAPRVAVFDVPPGADDLELARRGFPGEDLTSQQVRLLRLLGVRVVERIPNGPAGTHSEAAALPAWLRESRYVTAILVTSPDHSRRTRRIIARALDGEGLHVLVRPASYSDFDPQQWWRDRDGVRTVVVEWQKLALDLVTHPLGF